MKIGVCIIDHNKNIIKLERGPLFQGWGFKDTDAFEHHLDAPCYVPELFDIAYTKKDILTLCDNQESIARKIFYQLDWQAPETLLDEELRDGELCVCEHCGRMYECYRWDRCPHCS